MTSSPEWALITGVTSGLGLDFANIFGKNGINLILVSRNESKLKTLSSELEKKYGVRTFFVAADLSIIAEVQKVYDAVSTQKIELNYLVNNAGVGTFGYFGETPLEKELELIQLNLCALTMLTRLFLGDMLVRNRGYILNIGSVAGFQPVPLMSSYAASKAFVNSFSQGLAYELRKTAVSVSVLCPGPFHSGFESAANMHNSRNFKGRMLTSMQIAERGYRGMLRKKKVIIPAFSDRFLVFIQRVVPRALVVAVAETKVTFTKT